MSRRFPLARSFPIDDISYFLPFWYLALSFSASGLACGEAIQRGRWRACAGEMRGTPICSTPSSRITPVTHSFFEHHIITAPQGWNILALDHLAHPEVQQHIISAKQPVVSDKF